jgi:hypothetical protein
MAHAHYTTIKGEKYENDKKTKGKLAGSLSGPSGLLQLSQCRHAGPFMGLQPSI